MKLPNVEDMYPLTPTQQGMLFHTLYAPQSGIYCVQAGMTLHTPVDTDALRDAWRAVLERHAILRTAFLWEGLDEALQVVHQHVPLPWEELDWQHLSAAEQQAHLAGFLQEDRTRGFVVSRAPLMRLTCIYIAPSITHCIWSYHHLLLDGWSMMLLLDEVFALYSARQHQRALSLPHRRPYRDYIAWLQSQNLDEATQFWHDYMRDFTSATALPVDQRRSPMASGEQKSAEQEVHLIQEVTSRLHALARTHQFTLNVLLQGIWALLLHHYSGSSDILFGATISTRPVTLPGVEQMIGLFINTLPIRIQVDGELPVTSWLQCIQREQAEARQYDFMPLVQIQSGSEVPPGSPLFESLLVFENYPSHSPASSQGVVTTEDLWWGSERATYPLTLTVGLEKALLLRAGYERNRFTDQTITQLLGHLCTMLEAIATQPGIRVRDVPLLSQAERSQLLTEWSQGPLIPQDAPACLVHTLFERQAAQTPDAIALCAGDTHITYQELNVRARQLALRLREAGAGPERYVGIYLESSIALVIATLATLKTGGAYVPLDPTYPEERLHFMLNDVTATGLTLVLTQSTLRASLPRDLTCIELDQYTLEPQSSIGTDLHTGAHPANVAYVVYTSGSTGRPKGVEVTHQGLGNLARAQQQAFTVTPGSRVLQFASWSFDAAVSEWTMTLLAGATLCLASHAETLPGLSLLELLDRQAITTVTLPPSALLALPIPSAGQLTALHTLIVAGEACSGEVLAPWIERTRVFNAYGPSESSVCATLAPCTAGEARPPIGRPISHMQVYLLDAQMQPVPAGVVGELYIGGSGLARGYLRLASLTAERFVPHPFSVQPGARLYRTGDLALYRHDGNLEFVGRNDQQVKVRGYRIEIGEIEHTLRLHKAVREAVVLLQHDTLDNAGIPRLIACIVPADHATFSSHESRAHEGTALHTLREFLLKTLPDYMVPATFLIVEQLPCLPNGKLDRKKLLSLVSSQQEETLVSAQNQPRNSVETTLAEIWCEVLALDQVGIHDNFFNLGGHSLLATQIFSRIREQFQLEFALHMLFEAPTIAQLAEAIVSQALAMADDTMLAGLLETHETSAPLHAQMAHAEGNSSYKGDRNE